MIARTQAIRLGLAAVALVVAASLGACRGGVSKKPPIHPVLDMDFQQKLKAQTTVAFPYWSDKRSMRTPPAGTIAQGALADDALEVFQDAEGNYVDNPLPATEEVLRRGHERFDIHCAVCHDRSASGNGMVLQRAKVVSPAAFNYALPNLATDERIVGVKDGYLYQVITKGQATMPSYAHQVPVHDRWAIVHYVRALQNRFQ